MKFLTLAAPAKVNLYLEVLGRRPDGYHELLTLFHRISLCDRIRLTKIKPPIFELTTNSPQLKSARHNLMYNAWKLLKHTVRWQGGVSVALDKRIPIAAGLGGGSSDAASFLVGMNQLFSLALPQITLLRLGARLGADVPFFIHNTTEAVGRGLGEILTPTAHPKKYWFVLVAAPFGISTARAYKTLSASRRRRTQRIVGESASRLTRRNGTARLLSTSLSRSRRDKYSSSLRNDLTLASISIRPELQKLVALFDQLGLRRTLMSGSGPTMVSLHDCRKDAAFASRSIKRARPDLTVFICRSY
jgi:4-diphosphocytidyl-2-C-methyl-D-erythritol kinase